MLLREPGSEEQDRLDETRGKDERVGRPDGNGVPRQDRAGASGVDPGARAVGVALGVAVFAFTTILGWSFYGEKCWEYLTGSTSFQIPFRLLWTAVVFVGAVAHLEFVWLVADTLNALMALPNLLSLILLSPVVVQLTRAYFAGARPAMA